MFGPKDGQNVSVPAKTTESHNDTGNDKVIAKPRSHWRLLLCVLILIIGLIPAIRMGWHISATGANAISTDYIYIVPLIDRMLAGSYQWQNLLSDTFILQHICPLSILAHLANAILFEFDNRADLWVGFAFTFASAVLFASALARSLWQRIIVFAAVMLLSFGTTRASALLYGEPAIALGLTTFGFSLGAWGLMQFPQKLIGSLLMLLGGLISSYAWGMAPPCWFAYLVMLISQRTKSIRDYGILVLGVVLSFFPYFGFLPVSHATVASGQTKIWAPNITLILNNLGRTFSNELATRFDSLPLALSAGIAGVMACLIFWFALRKAKISVSSMPAIIGMCAYGFSTSAFLALFRNVSMPWYIPLTAVFWNGVVALAIIGSSVENRLCRILSAVSLVCITAFYCATNINYQGKNIFEMMRSPASESCIRHYEIAPTYMELSVCSWGLMGPDVLTTLAEPMRRHGLSAFSSKQQWTLQGDYGLPIVTITNDSGDIGVNWIRDRDPKRIGLWDAPEHLNLYLSAGSSVQWTVTVPRNAISANLNTSVSRPQLKAIESKPPVALASIALKTPSSAEHQIRKVSDEWQECKLELSKFRGKEIVLTFAAPSKSDVVFKYPVIDVRVDKKAAPSAVGVERTPCNSDLSPLFPKRTDSDLVLDPKDKELWVSSGLKELENGWESTPAQQGSITYTGSLDIPIRNYSHFAVQTSFTEDIKPPRALHVGFTLKSGRLVRFPIVLLSDGKMHSYSYDLKLLQLTPDDRVIGIQLYPQTLSVTPGKSMVIIDDVRLIGRSTENRP